MSDDSTTKPTPRRWAARRVHQEFSAVLRSAMDGEPTVVTFHGFDAVVVVSVEDYRRWVAMDARAAALAAPAMADLVATQAAEIDRLTAEADAYRTVGTPLGDRLRGDEVERLSAIDPAIALMLSAINHKPTAKGLEAMSTTEDTP